MPRDEPVGSLGWLALKPTEFREQVGPIGLHLLHDFRLVSMIRVATNSLGKQAPKRDEGEDRNRTLLSVSESALAADGAVKSVAKGAPCILRPRQ
jgi:hypothetical protein